MLRWNHLIIFPDRMLRCFSCIWKLLSKYNTHPKRQNCMKLACSRHYGRFSWPFLTPTLSYRSVWFTFLPSVIRTCETCINCDSWRPDRTMTQIKYELARMQCWCKMGLSATNQCIDIFFYWYSWNVSKMKLTPRGEHSYLYNIHFSRNNLCPAFRDIQC